MEQEEKEGKEEITVKQEELQAEPESIKPPETVRQKSVTETVVKAVTFTASAVAFASVCLYLLYMLCRSVRVYHQDGEGGAYYAGSCLIQRTANGFELRISDRILEQSATGQFELRPGCLFVKKYKGEELLVIAGNRRESVWIDREIPLRISSYI